MNSAVRKVSAVPAAAFAPMEFSPSAPLQQIRRTLDADAQQAPLVTQLLQRSAVGDGAAAASPIRREMSVVYRKLTGAKLKAAQDRVGVVQAGINAEKPTVDRFTDRNQPWILKAGLGRGDLGEAIASFERTIDLRTEIAGLYQQLESPDPGNHGLAHQWTRQKLQQAKQRLADLAPKPNKKKKGAVEVGPDEEWP